LGIKDKKCSVHRACFGFCSTVENSVRLSRAIGYCFLNRGTQMANENFPVKGTIKGFRETEVGKNIV
jgi:hypothetical protein